MVVRVHGVGGLFVQCNGVAVAANHGVLVASRGAALAGVFALEHLAVLCDAVTVTLRDLVVVGDGLLLGRCPRQVVAADLDVVVGKLAQLVVVHAEEFGFL